MTRIQRILVPAAVAVLAGVPIGIAAAGSVAPGSTYQWAQPGTAPVPTSGAEPALPGSVAPVPVSAAVSAYVWAQPGTAPVDNPFAQPPASIIGG